jgi:class 3 adenylate cyclase
MEPQIRFCTSADGTRIAYQIAGEGPPLLSVSSWGSNAELEWEDPASRECSERLGFRRRTVRVARRGADASQRDVQDISLDAQVSDVAAVADGLGLESFDLVGHVDGGIVATAYAAQNPERVRRLVLLFPHAHGPDTYEPERLRRLLELIRTDWSLARRMLAGAVYPTGPVEGQRWLSRLLRESITPEMAARHVEFTATVDVRPLLPLVQAPTLVLNRRGNRNVPISASRAVASLIPDARFLALEGDISYPWHGDTSCLDSVLEFLDEGLQSERPAAPATTSPAVHTILFTDVEGSTALTDRLGDAAAREVMREHERITREALKAHGGSEVKTMGDGFMASFGSATKALECAVAIQRALTPDPSPAAAGEGQSVQPFKVRIGLNAGEPIAEDDPDGRSDLFGTAVIVAARIAAQAEGGEILVSDVVRQLVAGKGFLFNDRGEQALKGLEDPVRVWEVLWSE